MSDEGNDILAAVHDGAKEGAKESRMKLRDRRLLILFVFLVILCAIGADFDARYRANNDRSGLSQEFCDQQAAFRSLPARIHLPPRADETTRKLVASVQRIQHSGSDLYVKFDCPAKR